MKLKRRAERSDKDNVALFQVVTVHRGTPQPEFYAKSLVNDWRGINRNTSDEAKEDGKMHAEALKFLFSGRLR